MGACRQLRGVLWKNALLKRAGWLSTLFEVAVPVAMMSLTVLLKDLSTQYDNPAIAYTCGPARPFDTSQPALLPVPDVAWVGCLQRPAECAPGAEDTQGYYQLALPALPPPFDALIGQLYGSIGSVNFLSFTVGDASAAFEDLPIDGISLSNPSLTLPVLMSRLVDNQVVLALVQGGPAADVAAFAAWLEAQAPGNGAAVRLFASEAQLQDFIEGPDYENPAANGAGKVAFALVFEETDRAAATWRYTIRANYTSPVFGQQRQPTVACLYPFRNSRRQCRFQWTVPSTREPAVRRFRQLPSRSRLYGYAYGGFSTLQLAVDTYILFGDRTGDVTLQPSYSLFPVPHLRCPLAPACAPHAHMCAHALVETEEEKRNDERPEELREQPKLSRSAFGVCRCVRTKRTTSSTWWTGCSASSS